MGHFIIRAILMFFHMIYKTKLKILQTYYIDLDVYLEKMRIITEQAKDLNGLYSILNGDECIAVDHSVYIDMNKINLGKYEGSQLVLQWYERNLKIFSNLQNICEKEDKVLVLIGS